MPFLLIFLIIPLMELGVFMTVGDHIGLGPTLLICVLTALIGGWLVKLQGMGTLQKAQKSLNDGFLPVHEIFDGLCILVSGALLLTPGFVTDFIGFALLIPLVRVHLRNILETKIHIVGANERADRKKTPRNDDILEGQYERLDDEDDHKA